MKRIQIHKILKDESWLTISNFLTLSRFLLTFFIVYGIFYKSWKCVFILFLIVGITDLLDGYLARLLKQDTHLGKILDPLVDKFLIIASFSSLAFFHSPSFFIPYWFVVLIIIREFIILLGSSILLLFKNDFKVSPNIWGKLTTFFQLLFILWIFICYFFGWVPAKTYYSLLILLSIFSILSLFQYVKIGLKFFLIHK
ncbi:CDP-diacylglycerol--glycerol-3-phosphate 3-phosphatidyltransferase [Candidatus Dependentiae bacterium]|nr:CDP-diacylglycerol--glycerol-3-phosphate 3-phosphatidyltransferase [Candidatus Dependentiae bacterium]